MQAVSAFVASGSGSSPVVEHPVVQLLSEQEPPGLGDPVVVTNRVVLDLVGHRSDSTEARGPMTFNSLQYAVFLPVVYVIYHWLKTGRQQNGLIFVAGSIFYGLFDWRFLGLLYLSIAVDYCVGRWLAGTDDARRRKLLLALSLCVQLGILAVFKYFDFFSESVVDLLDIFGITADAFTLDVVLPVGISFYTFQSLNYVFAVYRRQMDAEHDLVTFAAFVAWFPQLVAGPIERASSLLGQIRVRRGRPNAATTETALLLILRGLFKKVVIADSVAAYVNKVFDDPGAFRWSALLLGTVGFAVQVYGDFSGYSDIARGSSRLLGVELRRNFEQPFLSRNIREFWQRWHTSLGAWFVENVAQPLGGGKGGRARAMAVVVFMFGLIGLWHGAAWPFVIWGLYNGVLVALGRLLPPSRAHPMRLKWTEIPQIASTFGLYLHRRGLLPERILRGCDRRVHRHRIATRRSVRSERRPLWCR